MKIILLFLSLALYICCLFFPAVEFERVSAIMGPLQVAGVGNEASGPLESMRGCELLVYGPFGLLFGQLGALGWLANPLYFTCVLVPLVEKDNGYFKWLSMVALSFALASLFLTNWFPLVADEGSVVHRSAVNPLLGYWLWLLAIVLICVFSWYKKSDA